jgi:CelD/BcsL family acetyltransferase involved in cellulose biosynthesis
LRVSAHDFRFQPFLDLPDDVSTYESRYGSKHQRRNWRRLLALGASPHLVRDPEEIEPVIRELIAMRRARANRKGQRQAHMDPRFERFLIDAVCALIPDGARLWTLEVEEQTLAVCLNLVEGPREHGYLLGLGDSHTSLSPGTLLKRHALLEAIADGRGELDLGPGRDESKYRLGAIDRKLVRLIVVNSSPRARISSTRATIDLKLRNTAAADALRRRRGIVSERATAGSANTPPLAAK